MAGVHEERREVHDVGELAGKLEHPAAAARDQDRQVAAERREVELRSRDADLATVERHGLAGEHAPADLDRLADRGHRTLAFVCPKGRLLDAGPDAEDRSTVREVVHRRVRERGQRGMTDVRIGHEALDLELRGRLQAGGHHDKAVVIEAPIAHPEAVQALPLAELRELDELSDRIHPADRWQVPESELHRAAPPPIPAPCLALRTAVSRSETVSVCPSPVNVTAPLPSHRADRPAIP